tara:strand:+ start:1742 stop:2167 length:426 start_codon:yes stop_codon:yes gene_type:complete
VLEQFDGGGALGGVALEALFQKVDALVAELLAAGQLGRVALGNVVHDGPFVVHGRPGPAAGCHFKDDAAEGPDVDGAVAARGATADDFGGHVHGRAGHGALATLARGRVFGGKGSALAGDEFGGAEVDELDDTIVIKKNVY